MLKPTRRRMLVVAFLAQNCATGMTGGTFGPIVHALQTELSLSRGEAAGGMGALLFVLGLSAPLVGRLLTWLSIRTLMIAGAALCSLAYLLLTHVTNRSEMLLLFGVVGLGECMLGIIAPVALISRWFEQRRGFALGLINIPLMLVLAPLLAARVVIHGGASAVFAMVSVVFAALIPLLFLVIDEPPGKVRDAPSGIGAAPAGGRGASEALTNLELLRRWRFWLMALSVGALAGGGTSFVVHAVPFAMDKGLDAPSAAWLSSLFAAAGFAGAPLCGLLADRVGALRVLCGMSLGLAVLWVGVVLNSQPVLLYLLAGAIGLLTMPLTAMHGAAANQLFGARNVPVVMGLSYLIKLPFLACSAPLVGHLFDVTGGYRVPFLVHAACFCVAALMFFILVAARRQPGADMVTESVAA